MIRFAGCASTTARLLVWWVLTVLTALPAALLPTAAAAASAVSKAQAANDADAARILESERFRRLAVELRCLVCQNQSLADSDAPLAQDLRNEVVRLIASGRDDRAIKSFLVDRYGEFVLYRPTLSARNAVLWLGPFLLLLIGGIAWWRLGRTAAEPAAKATAAATDARQALARVDNLLGASRPDQHDGSSSRHGP